MPVQIGQAEPGFEDPIGLMVACHRRIERFLAVMIDVAIRRSGSTLTETDRSAMETALRYFRDAAPHHTADEEYDLFPALAQADGQVVCELPDLEHDHRRAERLHSTVDELGLAWLRDDALNESNIRDLQSALDDLAALYREHIRTEEERVFPEAQRTLSQQDLEKIGRDMASRRSIAYIPPTLRLTATALMEGP
jgi:hemerythrin-like domain-containing protein